MKIDLEYPYNKDWSRGYLVVNPEGRKTVILYNSHSKRGSTAYARYLLSVKLGRYLLDDEQADHINNDKTDDRIENLQLLSKEENRVKETNRYWQNKEKYVILNCPVCGSEFKYLSRNYRFHTKNGRTNFNCSRKCAAESLRKTLG